MSKSSHIPLTGRFLLLAYFILCFIEVSNAQNENLPQNNYKVLKVGAEIDYPPYSLVDRDGNPAGFSVELFNAAAGRMGIETEFVTGTWEEIKNDLAEGRLDALPLVGRTPERENIFDFSFSYLTMHGSLFVREEEDSINELEDLEGREVAVMTGDNAEEFLRRKKLQTEIISLKTFEKALLELSKGKYDAVFVQQLVGFQIINKLSLPNLKVAGPPVDDFVQSFCFAVKEGDHELLSILNEGLSIVIADGTFQRLYSKWFSSLETIDQIRTRIIIGGDYDYPPFEYLDENGQPAGYNVELTYAIARQLGVNVDIRLRPWKQTIEALENREIDVVQGMYYSPERDLNFNLSQAHTYVSQVIVVRKETRPVRTMADLKDKSILVQEGDIMHEHAVKMGYEDQLILVNSQEKALEILAGGSYDCALVSKILYYYWQEQNNWKNLRIIETPVLSAEYCYAFPEGNNALLSQFSEGLAALKASGEYREIHSRWLGVYENPELEFLDILRYSLIFIIPVVLLLIIFIIWNRTLGRRVRSRTRELRKEIEIRKEAEEQLIKRQNHIRLLLNSTAEAIYGIDLSGNCTFANNACVNLLGYNHYNDLVGKNMHDLIHYSYSDGKPMPRNECRIYKAIQEGKGTHVDNEVLWRADGSSFPAEYWSYPQYQDNEVVGAVVTFIDVTDRKRAEHEQKENEIKLKELNATKDKFFSLIAHDLKNPIGTIIGFLDLLKNDFNHYERDKIEKYINTIHQAASQAYTLLENLLVWGQSQTGRIEFNPEAVDVRDIVEEAVNFVEHQANKKKIKIEINIEDDEIVMVDKNMILTILRNLLTNAIKYSKTESEVKINLVSESDELLFSVKDYGTGMDQKTLGQLFLIENTQSRPGTNNEIGTGLGLIISKEFVNRHNGRIWAESIPGEGSIFRFTISKSL